MTMTLPRSEARSRRPRTLTFGIVIALVGALFAAVFAPATSASASDTANVTIMITSKSGTPLTGLTVQVGPDSAIVPFGTGVHAMADATGVAGEYRATGLTVGIPYWIAASEPSGDRGFSYGSAGGPHASTITFSAGENRVSFSRPGNATIAGDVTLPGAGDYGGGVVIRFWRFNGVDWDSVGYAESKRDGTYAISKLEAGQYRVEFDTDNFAPVYSGGATELERATVLTVSAHSTTTVNARFTTRVGSLWGYVLGQDGEYDTNVEPFAYRLEGKPGAFTGRKIAGVGNPHGSDRWKVDRLAPGYYVVLLTASFAGESDHYSQRYVGGGLTWNDPNTTVMQVRSLEETYGGLTIVPHADSDSESGRLSVTVKSESGAPLVGARVGLTALDPDVSYRRSSATDDRNTDGDGFMFYAMPPGEYLVTAYWPGTGYWPDTSPTYPQVSVTLTVVAGYQSETITLLEAEPYEILDASITNGDSPTVGTTFTAAMTTNHDTGEHRYQWFRNGRPIFGARSAEYTATGSDVGHQLTVVIASSIGLLKTTVAVSGPIVDGDPPANLAAPAIWTTSDPLIPGTRLTASPGSWDLPTLRFGYQWLRDGTPVPGAVGGTYVVADADAEHDLSVRVTATTPGRPTSAPLESASLTVANRGPLKLSESPVVTSSTTGLPTGQRRYTVSSGSWSPSATSYRYDWFADGEAIPAAAGQKSWIYDASGAEAGAAITVQVTAMRLGHADGVSTRLARKGTAQPIIATPWTMTREGLAGSPSPLDLPADVSPLDVIRAAAGSLSYPDAEGGSLTTRYQWQRAVDGVTFRSIEGATSSTYRVSATDLGSTLRLVVTSSSSHYAPLVQYLVVGTVHARTELVDSASPTLDVLGSGRTGTVHRMVRDGAWPVSSVSTAYRWSTCDPATAAGDCLEESDWTRVSGATTSTYTPPASSAGRLLRGEVIGSRSGFATSTRTSEPISLVTSTAITALSAPQLAGLTSGDAQLGVAIRAGAASWDTDSVTRSYRWESCVGSAEECAPDSEGWATIPGSTSTSFTPIDAALTPVGSWLRVVERAARTGLTPGEATSAPAMVATGSVRVTSPPKVISSGASLSVNSGAWSPTPTTVVTTWYVDGTEAGTGAGFDASATSPSSAIFVEVRASREGYEDAVSSLLARRGAAPVATSSPAAVGLRYGETFVAPEHPFDFAGDPGSVTIAYQWYVNGSAIDGARSSTFRPAATHIGKAVKVRLVVSSSRYATASYTTPSVVVQHGVATGGDLAVNGDVDGATRPGSVLSAALVMPSPSVSISYRWQRSVDSGASWAAISGATATSYKVTTTDPGSKLRLVITGTRSGYEPVTFTSEVISVEHSIPLEVRVAPSVNGTARVGSKLTIDPGVWNASSVTFRYQWFVNGVALPGATNSTFTPIAEYFRDTVHAEVTASKAGHVPVTVTTDAHAIAEGTAPTATEAPKISGSAVLGGTVRSTTGVWNRDNLIFTYRWFAGGVEIDGVTGNVLVLGPEQVGLKITVRVVAASHGYASGTSGASSATATVSP
jgi:hypothetical protein